METYIKDAEYIWSDFNKRLSDDMVFKDLHPDDQLEFYQKNYDRFTMTFPIVLRYMIHHRQYHTKAFSRHVKKMNDCPYRSELEYCERQADYVKYLFMVLNPKYNTKEANNVWTKTYDMLVNEIDMFKKAEERVRLKLEKNNIQNSIEKRAELKEALRFSNES